MPAFVRAFSCAVGVVIKKWVALAESHQSQPHPTRTAMTNPHQAKSVDANAD